MSIGERKKSESLMGIKLKTICVTVSKLNTQPHDQVLSSSFPLESVSVNHWANCNGQ